MLQMTYDYADGGKNVAKFPESEAAEAVEVHPFLEPFLPSMMDEDCFFELEVTVNLMTIKVERVDF